MSKNTIKYMLLSAGILLSAVGCSEASEPGNTSNDDKSAGIVVAASDLDAQAEADNKAAADMDVAPSSSKPAAPKAEAAPAEASAAAAGGEAKTVQEALKAEFGTLKNPYTGDEKAIKEGQKLYLSYSCNGCHGGGGGGGMCPPLTNETFVYGSDDDVIFRLIAMGSDSLTEKHGLKRVGQENVVGPMPAFEEIIDTDEKLWKIIAFIRSKFKGRDKKINW